MLADIFFRKQDFQLIKIISTLI